MTVFDRNQIPKGELSKPDHLERWTLGDWQSNPDTDTGKDLGEKIPISDKEVQRLCQNSHLILEEIIKVAAVICNKERARTMSWKGYTKQIF